MAFEKIGQDLTAESHHILNIFFQDVAKIVVVLARVSSEAPLIQMLHIWKAEAKEKSLLDTVTELQFYN